MPAGKITNQTGEDLAVYGPPRLGEKKATSLYRLGAGKSTPEGWDCDGFYVPNDRSVDQVVGPDLRGPIAIKYMALLSPTISRQGSRYQCPPNQGSFRPREVCCPSKYPKCICWPVPDIPQSQVRRLPPAPDRR
jgi:hypothetical protein